MLERIKSILYYAFWIGFCLFFLAAGAALVS